MRVALLLGLMFTGCASTNYRKADSFMRGQRDCKRLFASIEKSEDADAWIESATDQDMYLLGIANVAGEKCKTSKKARTW